ncbi:hypothetical protein C8R44DRAFT_741938 [Mycena epipterygia]|nr:hypothetical protein C8R44DRAFT_741938 [Mycena epipterygia]
MGLRISNTVSKQWQQWHTQGTHARYQVRLQGCRIPAAMVAGENIGQKRLHPEGLRQERRVGAEENGISEKEVTRRVALPLALSLMDQQFPYHYGLTYQAGPVRLQLAECGDSRNSGDSTAAYANYAPYPPTLHFDHFTVDPQA